MVRLSVIAVLAAVTIVATACEGTTAREQRPATEASQGKEGNATTNRDESNDDLSASRTEIDRTQTADGARVALQWVYADENSVEVCFTVEDLQGGGGSEGIRSSSSQATTRAFVSPTKVAPGSGWPRLEGQPLQGRAASCMDP